MIVLVFAVGLVLCPFISTKVEAQIADECKCSNRIYYDIWMSIPPVEDTSITVYYCAYRYIFYYPCCGDRLVIRAGIKPAEASDSEWEYFNVLDVICNGSIDCYLLMYNFSNYLIDRHVFNGLSKNKTYTLKNELYVHYPYGRYSEEIRNITTFTKDIEVATTTYSVTISYPTEYQYIYTQPQPQGHRSLLWKMDENGHVTTVAERYTALPSRSTTIYSLQPNTLYSLHTWANESCYSWMVTVTTTPLVPISPRVAIIPRDTSAIFHIMAGRTNELIERCSFELENVTFEIKVFNSTLAILTGLVAGTRYNISSFAVSNSQGSSYSLAMEYYVFVTTQKVSLKTSTHGKIELKWSAPHLLSSEDSVTGYDLTIYNQENALDLTYSLPSDREEITVEGLQGGMFFVELLVSSVMQPNYQPFYAENISLSTLSTSDNTNFQSAQDGAIGGGIVLAIVLVLLCLIVTVCLLCWKCKKVNKGGGDLNVNDEAARNQTDIHMQNNPSYAAVVMSAVKDKQDEVTDEPRYFIENEAKVYEDVSVEPKQQDDARKKELKTKGPTYANVDRSV